MAIDPQYNVPLSADELNSQIPTSILYGVTPDDKFIPIRIDDDGRVQISADTPVVVDDVDIIIKGVDPENGNLEHRISVDNLGVGNGFAIRSALFDDGNKLKINPNGSLDVNIISGVTLDVNLDNANDNVLIYGQDSGAVNRPLRVNTSGQAEVVVVSSALPTGAATETTLAGIKATTDQLTISASRLLVDGSGVVQPVSGTVTATQGTSPWVISGTVTSNIGTTGGLALDTTLSSFRADFNAEDFATETTLSGIKAQTDLLTFSGSRLQVDTGTVTVNQGTSPWVVSVSNFPGTQAVTQSGNWSVRLQDGVGTDLTSTLVSGKQALDVNITNAIDVALDQSTDSVQVFGNDGTTNRAIKTTTAGEVLTDPIDRVTREVGRVLSSHKLFATEVYNTINTYASARPVDGDLDVQHYHTKQWVIKNTGANAARITVIASVDAGTNFDVTITNNLKLDPGNVIVTSEERAFTTIRIQARSDAAGQPTTIETRGYALGI